MRSGLSMVGGYVGETRRADRACRAHASGDDALRRRVGCSHGRPTTPGTPASHPRDAPRARSSSRSTTSRPTGRSPSSRGGSWRASTTRRACGSCRSRRVTVAAPPRRLTRGHVRDTRPAISPDGTPRRVHAGDPRRRRRPDLPAGPGPRRRRAARCCRIGELSVRELAWSPDGRRIAFTARTDPQRLIVGTGAEGGRAARASHDDARLPLGRDRLRRPGATGPRGRPRRSADASRA